MKPASFNYVAANTIDDAIAALSRHPDAKLLAGGQSFVPMMNFRLVKPAWLIDINRIAELKGIRLECRDVVIGAMTRHVELEQSGLLRKHVPLIGETVALIGHTAIRNRGTIGGSISHADPAANLAVALLALDATVHVRGARGARSIAIDEFFVSLFTTALAPNEIVTAIAVRTICENEGHAFTEFARRHGDFALASAAAKLRVKSGRIDESVRIALGGVGAHAVRARGAEQVLAHAAPSAGLFEAAAKRAAQEIEPPSDVHGSAAYRKHLIRGLVKDVLTQAFERATGGC
jgi:CO/xanthine dehydrogenase FAD-binding subunit